MVQIKDIQFCVKNLKMKRKKGQKTFDLRKRGFKPQIFGNFPAHFSTVAEFPKGSIDFGSLCLVGRNFATPSNLIQLFVLFVQSDLE